MGHKYETNKLLSCDICYYQQNNHKGRKILSSHYTLLKTICGEGKPSLLTSKQETTLAMGRHFNTLLNVDRAVDMAYVLSIFQLLIANELDNPL